MRRRWDVLWLSAPDLIRNDSWQVIIKAEVQRPKLLVNTMKQLMTIANKGSACWRKLKRKKLGEYKIRARIETVLT